MVLPNCPPTAGAAVDINWNPYPAQTAGRDMNALALAGTNLYVAGYFTNIGGIARVGLAKLSTTAGRLTRIGIRLLLLTVRFTTPREVEYSP